MAQMPMLQSSLNRTSAVSALKYTSPDADGITAYRIEVSEDGADWKTGGRGNIQRGNDEQHGLL